MPMLSAMARIYPARFVRLLALLLAASLLAACEYSGSPSGSPTLAAADPPPSNDPITASLTWGTASGPVAGYRVYESRDGGAFQATTDVGLPTTSVTGLPGETIQVQVAALDAMGNEGPMSDPSPVLSFTVNGVGSSSPASTPIEAASATSKFVDPASAPAAAAATATASDAPPANAESAVASATDGEGAASTRLDISGSGTSDLLWETAEGDRLRVTNADLEELALFDRPAEDWELVAMADLDGDGLTDLLWAQASGALALSRIAPSLATQPALDFVDAGSLGDAETIRGSGDFDGDGAAEVLVQDAGTGAFSLWSLAAGAAPGIVDLGFAPGAGQTVAGTRDYDGDGDDDILFHGEDGGLTAWLLGAAGVEAIGAIGAAPGGEVLASGDFDGDGFADVARRDASGAVELLLLGGGLDAPAVLPGLTAGSALEPAGAGDFDGDGRSDLLWLDPAGAIVIWFMDPGLAIEALTVSSEAGWNLIPDWR